MPRRAKVFGPREGAPYYAFSLYFDGLIAAWCHQQAVKRLPSLFVYADVEPIIGIYHATLSHFRCGTKRPTEDQCLSIARFFHVPIGEVLQSAGYDDVPHLRRFIEQSLRGFATGEKVPDGRTLKDYQDIYNILKMLQMNLEWRDLASDSPAKELAEDALASNKPPYNKAKAYTDVVWLWYEAGQQKTTRGQRQTGEMARVTESSSAVA